MTRTRDPLENADTVYLTDGEGIACCPDEPRCQEVIRLFEAWGWRRITESEYQRREHELDVNDIHIGGPMPRKRQPLEIWRITRRRIWLRDGGQCQSPHEPPLCVGKPFIGLHECHIDHIQSGKLGTNADDNLRTLCPVCHALRNDRRHQGLVGKMLHKGLIPANWHELVWD